MEEPEESEEDSEEKCDEYNGMDDYTDD